MQRVASIRDEGHSVETSGSGRFALQLVLSHEPDVVVTDQQMPEIDGMTLIRTARQAGVHSYFILVCGSPPEDADGIADLILAKPLRIERLFEALERLAMKTPLVRA